MMILFPPLLETFFSDLSHSKNACSLISPCSHTGKSHSNLFEFFLCSGFSFADVSKLQANISFMSVAWIYSNRYITHSIWCRKRYIRVIWKISTSFASFSFGIKSWNCKRQRKRKKKKEIRFKTWNESANFNYSSKLIMVCVMIASSHHVDVSLQQ